ncbi:MAG: flagellar motor protein [Polyangiaceae bacterium]
MNPGPLIGIAVALLCIIVGNMIEGGHIASLIGGPAFMIVIGGTIGAGLVQYPIPMVKHGLSLAGGLFKPPKQDPQKLLDELVDYANKARKDGILGLEKLAPGASDPFLSKALMMAVDGADSNAIKETMEIIIGQEEEHNEEGAKVFEAMGGYSPTIGIIGAVLGLIHVMSNLSDIEKVGEGIAGAFVATIYGLVFANVLCLPLSARIKMQVKEQVKLKEMMLSGVLAIQQGMNPKLVRDRLASFLPAHGHGKGEAAAGAPAKAAA